jgi:flagellar hook-length control protein FliK
VIIAISTYTEPVPVNTAVSEPTQTHELKENEEPGEFAKLLEKLLQKPEKDEAEENSLAGFSEVEFDSDVLFTEEADAGNKSDLLGITKKIRDSLKEYDSDDEIPEEHLSVMLNSGHLFARSLEHDAAGSDTDDNLLEISDLIIKNNLLETELESDSFMIDSKETFGANDGVTQIAASLSAMQNEEALSAANGKKESLSKDRPVSKNENVEALSGKAARGEELASLRGKPENENPSRLDELRSRRRDRVTFDVRDMRTGETNSLNNTQTRSYTVTEIAAGRAHGETPVREITLELRLPEQHNGSTAQTTWEAKAGGTAIENLLARELHQNFNGDIVRHASIALRDGGEGTIKIALKPESLGNVKISLEMTENKITGHIVVESKEALNAFRKEIASLEQAFRDSGFTNADLNLSLTADGRNAQGQEQEQNSFTPRMIASRYDDSSYDYAENDARTIDVFVGRKSGSINMLA